MPVEVITDQAPVDPAVLEELLPAAWHRTDRYANNRVECDHGRLTSRLRPMRGLKQDRSARVIIAGGTVALSDDPVRLAPLRRPRRQTMGTVEWSDPFLASFHEGESPRCWASPAHSGSCGAPDCLDERNAPVRLMLRPRAHACGSMVALGQAVEHGGVVDEYVDRADQAVHAGDGVADRLVAADVADGRCAGWAGLPRARRSAKLHAGPGRHGEVAPAWASARAVARRCRVLPR